MKRRHRLRGCLLYGSAAILLLAAVTVLLFTHNNRPVVVSMPTPKVPNPNGWDDFVRASEMVDQIGHKGPLSDPNRTPDQWSVAEMRSFAIANEPAFVVFRQGLSRQYLHPPIRSKRDFQAVFSHYGELRELGRYLVGEGKYYSAIGEYEKAADSVLNCVELGVILPSGGSYFTGLVGRSIESIGFKEFENVIPKLDRAALSRVADRMEKIQRKRVSFSDMELEDGRSDTAVFADLLRSSEFRRQISNPVKFYKENELSGFDDAEEAAEDARYAMRICFANKASELRKYEAYYTALAAEQRGYYTGKSRVPVPEGNVVARFMGTSTDIKRRRVLLENNKTIFTLLQTQIALRRYYADHNRYPERLSQLVPKYFKSEPIDPFGLGKSLKYRQLASGKKYLLYSISANMHDDNGKLGDQLPPFDTGDLVAGQLLNR